MAAEQAVRDMASITCRSAYLSASKVGGATVGEISHNRLIDGMSRLIISNDSGGTCADHVNCVHLRRRLTCIPYPSPARLPPRLCRCQCLRALLDLGSSCVAVVCLCPSVDFPSEFAASCSPWSVVVHRTWRTGASGRGTRTGGAPTGNPATGIPVNGITLGGVSSGLGEN